MDFTVNYSLKIFSSGDELAEAFAEHFKLILDIEIKKKEKFSIALSGGTTPYKFLSLLPGKKISWEKIHLYWVDERCVPPDNSESNYGNTKSYLLNNANIPYENIHRIKGEENPRMEIVRYSEELLQNLPLKDNLPVFDWILLGMGNDGHTASIFPGQEYTTTYKNICGLSEHPKTKQKRITLTLPALNSAERVSFLISGKDKSGMFKKVFNNKDQNYPAAHVNPDNGILEWFTDIETTNEKEKFF